jgi:hypothetical protein
LKTIPRVWPVAAAVVGLLLATASGGHAGPGDPQARVLRKDGAGLWTFALDGTRLTGAAWNGKCYVISTWDLYAGGWKTSGLTGDCYAPTTDIAAAGGRIAWLMESGSISDAGFQLQTARYGGRPKTVLVTDAPIESASGDPGDADSFEIGDLVGGGSTLAYLTWTVHPNGVAGAERAWRLDSAGRPVLLAKLPGARSLAVDGDQVVALVGDATLRFLGGAPRTVRLATAASTLQPRHEHDLAIAGGQALVLERRNLQVFDATTGAQVASWPLPLAPAGARGLLDAAGGYASYLERDSIHVVRLTDGKNIVIRRTRMQPRRCIGDSVWAHLGAVGLVYAMPPSAACTTSRAGLITFAELATYF